MNRFHRTGVKSTLFVALFLLLTSPSFADRLLLSNLYEKIEHQKVADARGDFGSWVTVEQMKGDCHCTFPRTPDHMVQRLPMDGNRELTYDVYIADHNRQEVFMVLVAEYPGVVEEKYEIMTLENLLNSIISQSKSNTLVYADLTEVQGRKAIDFYIQSNNVMFKGRAAMKGRYLHLVAMECEANNYQEDHFNFFIQEFGFSGN